MQSLVGGTLAHAVVRHSHGWTKDGSIQFVGFQLFVEVPEASGRYLCANTTISMREAVRLLREKGWGEGRKLPKLGLDGSVGDMLVKLGAQFQPKGVRSYLRTHIGRVPRFDHAKIVDELGLAFRPLEESILETMDDLVKWGHLDPLPSEPTSA